MTSATTSSTNGTSKISKRKRKGGKVVESDSEDVVKQQAADVLQKALHQQSLNDEHQRLCDMLADELRRAHARNPDGAQQLRRNLLMTITNYWQNEPPQFMEVINTVSSNFMRVN